ncbi:uncharacterized protein LOC129046825 isoform X3 [Molothrus ater]|uniref:uncharacterized protein LOC129046825 isoform X3 n=1 Tax=Molothrus ater TaxID=84834 RepID=UPI0023E7EF5F|nr:uncharacterized protein LOC129046825 isoform X3 [Molothrus ater]
MGWDGMGWELILPRPEPHRVPLLWRGAQPLCFPACAGAAAPALCHHPCHAHGRSLSLELPGRCSCLCTHQPRPPAMDGTAGVSQPLLCTLGPQSIPEQQQGAFLASGSRGGTAVSPTGAEVALLCHPQEQRWHCCVTHGSRGGTAVTHRGRGGTAVTHRGRGGTAVSPTGAEVALLCHPREQRWHCCVTHRGRGGTAVSPTGAEVALLCHPQGQRWHCCHPQGQRWHCCVTHRSRGGTAVSPTGAEVALLSPTGAEVALLCHPQGQRWHCCHPQGQWWHCCHPQGQWWHCCVTHGGRGGTAVTPA